MKVTFEASKCKKVTKFPLDKFLNNLGKIPLSHHSFFALLLPHRNFSEGKHNQLFQFGFEVIYLHDLVGPCYRSGSPGSKLAASRGLQGHNDKLIQIRNEIID